MKALFIAAMLIATPALAQSPTLVQQLQSRLDYYEEYL